MKSSRDTQRIADFDTFVILLIVSDDNAVIRFRDGSDDGVEGAARATFCFSFCHQARPDQTGLLVKRQNATREKSLRPL